MKQTILLLALPLLLLAHNIKLPTPQKEGGAPLYTTLQNRATSRSFDPSRSLTIEQISQVLWAAAGKNRTKDKNRTVPSGWGNNEVELYVLLKSGSYRYDPVNHELILIAKGDNRATGGEQGFVKNVPMTIIMIADISKIKQTGDKVLKVNVAYVDAGYISQNIYLAAESEGLVTGARIRLDHQKIKTLLKLGKNHRVIIANSVGYEK